MSKRSRQRTREEILAKRHADDARRAKAKKPLVLASAYNPGVSVLYNPLRLPRKPGIIVIRKSLAEALRGKTT